MSANPARPPLVTLTEEERARALARYRLLQPHLEGGVALTAVARAHALPLRTAQRWVTRYRQDGLAGLVRHARTDRGKSRRCTPQLTQLIEALALRTPPRPPRLCTNKSPPLRPSRAGSSPAIVRSMR